MAVSCVRPRPSIAAGWDPRPISRPRPPSPTKALTTYVGHRAYTHEHFEREQDYTVEEVTPSQRHYCEVKRETGQGRKG